MTIAFIGLGLMGRPMAATLAAAGYKVIGFNRSQVEPPAGVALVSDVAEALRGADTIFVMLTDGPACESVLLDEAVRPLLAGKQVVNSSTISPEQSRIIEAAVSKAGGHYLESPVLGSIPEARSGSLQIMVGGQEADYHAVLPLLQVLGKPEYIGSVGQAAAIKLALNQLIGSLTAAFALSLGWCSARASQWIALCRSCVRARYMRPLSIRSSQGCWIVSSITPIFRSSTYLRICGYSLARPVAAGWIPISLWDYSIFLSVAWKTA